jgi:hypothetical protein
MQIHEVRLQLDDKEHSASCVERKDVDSTAFPSDRKRDLRRRIPLWVAIESAGDHFMHGGVAASQHPIKIAASPPWLHIDPDFKHVCDTRESADCHRVNEPALDARNGRCRDSRPPRHITLTKAKPMADRPHDRPEAVRIHLKTLSEVTY